MSKTRKKTLLEGADEILTVATEELVEESVGGDLYYLTNEDVARPKARRTKKRKGPFVEVEEVEAADFYGGKASYLVRTAVIRAADYDPAKEVTISEPAAALPLLQHLRFSDQEHFVTLCLSGKNKLMAIHETHIGGTSSAKIELKHVIKVALLVSASGVIYCHNHPSGDPRFSGEDFTLTRAVKEALGCVGLSMLDHLVVARDGWASHLEGGYAKKW